MKPITGASFVNNAYQCYQGNPTSCLKVTVQLSTAAQKGVQLQIENDPYYIHMPKGTGPEADAARLRYINTVKNPSCNLI
jgi:hypothetical protein